MTSQIKVIAPCNDRNSWRWGFTPQAENWNGRFAMLGFMSIALMELIQS
jgi:hypothetical protein